MAKTKILVVDDEPSILNLISAYLRAEGFDYQTATDGQAALRSIRSYHPDVIVLDIMLPGIDGIEVLSQLRRESDAYVIMLSAKSEELDKLVGLSVGADDYLTKPFSPRELIARIKAALRRLQNPSQESNRKVIKFTSIHVDTGSRRVWVKDEVVELTSLEFDLLVTMMRHNKMVLSREQLLEKAWGYDYYGDSRVVDVHIGHLRQKIGEKYIETVRGVGYRFEDAD